MLVILIRKSDRREGPLRSMLRYFAEPDNEYIRQLVADAIAPRASARLPQLYHTNS